MEIEPTNRPMPAPVPIPVQAPAPAPTVASSKIPCGACGYDLRGHAIGGTCPECGTPIGQLAHDTRNSNKAVASLVLGIVSLVGCMFYGLPSIICGPLAMVYARKARVAVQLNEAPPNSLSMAGAGRVCGLIGTILGGVLFVLMGLYILFFMGIMGAAIFGGAGGAGGGGGFGPAPVGP